MSIEVINDGGGNNICFSGGAIGADTAFGLIADKVGHRVVHYVFSGKYGRGDFRFILTSTQLLVADPFLREANQTLQRGSFDSYYEYTKNLLRRNYYQIKDTERVYAVSYLDDEQKVEGGTGWAVQMAIDKCVPEIYLFNQYDLRWYQGISEPPLDKYQWRPVDKLPPRPHGLYTGIGSSQRFTNDGHRAVEELYSTRENE